jgi:uncharacterized protein YoxC
MTELIEICVALLIAIIFAVLEMAITIWATDKTTERILKHNDECFRKIEQAIRGEKEKGDEHTYD